MKFKQVLSMLLAMSMVLNGAAPALAAEGDAADGGGTAVESTLPEKILEFDFDAADVVLAEDGKTVTGIKDTTGSITASVSGVTFTEDGIAVFPLEENGGISYAPTVTEDAEGNKSGDPMFALKEGSGATVSMWIKTAMNGINNPLFYYGAYKNANKEPGASVHIQAVDEKNTGVVYYRNASGSSGGGGHKLSTNVDYVPDTWQLVTFVEEADGNGTLYIDGVEKATVNKGSAGYSFFKNAMDENTPDEYHIGTLANLGTDHSFQGSMDSVTVYGGALTAEQVKALYDARKPELDLMEAKADLADALAAAKDTYDAGQDDWSDASWTAFKAAYEAAQAPAADADAAALGALTAALDEKLAGLLTTRAEAQAALKAAITVAAGVFDKGQDDYTDESWNEFIKAREAAIAVTDDAELQKISEATEALTEAIDGLVTKKEEAYAALNDAIADAKSLLEDEEKYTEDTFAAAVAALAAAEEAAAAEGATADSLNAAEKALESAVKALQTKLDAARAALRATLNSAPVNAEDYTEESWRTYEFVYRNSMDIFATSKSVEAINLADKELKTAIANLKKELFEIIKFEFNDADVLKNADNKVTGVKGIAGNQEIAASIVGVTFENGRAVYPAGGSQETVGITYAPGEDDPIKNIDSSKGVSIAMWIKSSRDTFSSTLFSYGSLQTEGNNAGKIGASAHVLARSNESGDIMFYRDQNGNTGGQKKGQNGNPYIKDTWQLVVFAEEQDDNNIKKTLYVDGKAVSTMTNSRSIKGFAADEFVPDYLYMGYLPYAADGSDTHFEGAIDSMVIYGKTLSEAEIAELYATRKPELDLIDAKEAMADAKAEAAKITEQGDYTDDTWAAFQDALKAANEVAGDASAEVLNELVSKLVAAQEALKTNAQILAEAKAALTDAITAAKALKEADYTAESWATFPAEITAAEAVVAKEDATLADVTAATTALTDAVDALVTKKAAAEAELATTIKAAEALVAEQGNYTNASWSRFVAALEAAKNLAEDATVDDINSLITALKDAQDKLVEAAVPVLEFDFDDADVVIAEDGTATIKGITPDGEVTATSKDVTFADGFANFAIGKNGIIVYTPTVKATEENPDTEGEGTGTEDGTVALAEGEDTEGAGTIAEEPGDPMKKVTQTGGVTIGMWIKTAEDTFSSPLFAYGALQENGALGASAHIHGRNNGSQEMVYYRDQNGSTGGQKASPKTNSPYVKDTWQYVTFVENEGGTGGGTLYIDGEAIATNPNGKTLYQFANDEFTPDAYYIGGLQNMDAADTHFAGSIDSVAVYDKALSEQEVKDLFAERKSELDLMEAQAALEAAIEGATAVYNAGNKDAYREASWNAFKAAYDAAVAKENVVTAKDYQELTTALTDAQDMLKAEQTLADAVAKAAPLEDKQADYTEATWKVFADALKAAKAPAEDAKPVDLITLATTLTEAQDKLVTKLEEARVAFAQVHAKVTTVDSSLYTAESLKKVEDADKAGVAEYNKGDKADAETLKQLTDALQKALDELESLAGKEIAAAKEALSNDITDAGKLVEADYTEDSWAALQDAIKAAQAQVDSEDATKESIADAQNKLAAAVAGLKTKLQAALDKFVALHTELSKLNKDLYTAESWNAVFDADEAALAEYNKETDDDASTSADAATLEALIAALEEAKGKLVLVETVELENAKTELASALEVAKKVYDAGQTDYTDASWNTFKTAYEEAVNAPADATAATVKDLLNKLTTAQNGLAKKTPTPEVTVLEAPGILSAKSVADENGVYVEVTVNPVNKADRYEVYRVVSGNVSLIATTKSGRVKVIDDLLVQKNVEYYAIAVSADGKVKSQAGQRMKVTLEAKPQIKKVSRKKSGVKITWKKNKNAKKYVVYRSTKKNSGYVEIARVKKSRRYYLDDTAKKGKRYYYKVVTIGKNHVSLMSGEKRSKK